VNPAPVQHGGPGGPPGVAARWPLVAELFSPDPARDWDWEGLRANGKLYLFCYFGDTVVALAPFDLSPQAGRLFPQ
jgi:hypothetical protein